MWILKQFLRTATGYNVVYTLTLEYSLTFDSTDSNIINIMHKLLNGIEIPKMTWEFNADGDSESGRCTVINMYQHQCIAQQIRALVT